MEAQRNPEVGGRPSWVEVGPTVHSPEWSDIGLPEGRSLSWQLRALGFMQTTLDPSHPVTDTDRVAASLPPPALAAGTVEPARCRPGPWSQQDVVLDHGANKTSSWGREAGAQSTP